MKSGPKATTAPVIAKAMPHDCVVVPPTPDGLLKSRVNPKISGPANEPIKPMQECTAMVVPRYPAGAAPTTPDVMDDDSPVMAIP